MGRKITGWNKTFLPSRYWEREINKCCVLTRKFCVKNETDWCMYFIHDLFFTISKDIEVVDTVFSFLCESNRKFFFWLWRHFPTAPPLPPKCWGGGRERLRNFQISRVELSSFLLFLGVRDVSSKQLKQVSIVGRTYGLLFRLKMYKLSSSGSWK